MPTYNEIVNDEDDDLSEDEELLTKQDTFERKYNFRFEEPGGTEVYNNLLSSAEVLFFVQSSPS